MIRIIRFHEFIYGFEILLTEYMTTFLIEKLSGEKIS